MVTLSASAEVAVTDFTGRAVRLSRPAERIVALSPHLVENLYSAGVGDRLVGVIAHSDYPPVARQVPRVGSYGGLSLEAIVARRPDLVVAWAAGGAVELIRRLRAFGIPVYLDAPRRLDDIARAIVDLGTLGGRRAHARRVASQFRARVSTLRARYAERAPVGVFYEVWNEPLQTLSNDTIVGRVVRLCGGRNVFADAGVAAPTISVESVLARDPQAIVVSGTTDTRPPWLNDWRRWPELRAVKHNHLFFIPPDLIQRPTRRVLQGAQRLCRQLDRVRGR